MLAAIVRDIDPQTVLEALVIRLKRNNASPKQKRRHRIDSRKSRNPAYYAKKNHQQQVKRSQETMLERAYQTYRGYFHTLVTDHKHDRLEKAKQRICAILRLSMLATATTMIHTSSSSSSSSGSTTTTTSTSTSTTTTTTGTTTQDQAQAPTGGETCWCSQTQYAQAARSRNPLVFHSVCAITQTVDIHPTIKVVLHTRLPMVLPDSPEYMYMICHANIPLMTFYATMATLGNGRCYLAASTVVNKSGVSKHNVTGLWTFDTYHAGDAISSYGGFMKESAHIIRNKRSHARVIPDTSQHYVYDGFDLSNIQLQEASHSLDPTLICLIPADINDKTSGIVMNSGVGFWINSHGKGQKPNVCTRWCKFDKDGVMPMECLIIALEHISPRTQLLCRYNNQEEQNGFVIERT